VTGSLPATLGELGWRLPPIFGNRGPVDPWGKPYGYRILDGNGFELTSGARVVTTEAAAWKPAATAR